MNQTHDFVFAEITTLSDWNFDHVAGRELYDVKLDPFQLTNLYDNASPPKNAPQLHAELAKLWGCVGSECP